MLHLNRCSERLVLAAASTLVGLAAAEGVVRLALPSATNVTRLSRYMDSERGKFARYDPLLGWDGLENAEADFEWLDARHHVKLNRHGYRGSEYDFERTARRRIVVLGDSFVWGFGVEDDEIFTSLLERRAGGTLEVVNLGVSGFGNDQEYLLWTEKGHRWQPDDVLLFFTPYTDLWDNGNTVRHGYPKPLFVSGGPRGLRLTNTPVVERSQAWGGPRRTIDYRREGWIQALAQHSALAAATLHALLRSDSIREYLEARNAIPLRLPGYEWEYRLYLTSPDAETERVWRLTFRILAALHDDVSRRGARLSLVIVPSVVQVYPEVWERFRVRPSIPANARLDPEVPNRLIAAWGRANGVRVIDLLSSFRQAGRSEPYLYFVVNRHWTRAGHALVAKLLLREPELSEAGIEMEGR